MLLRVSNFTLTVLGVAMSGIPHNNARFSALRVYVHTRFPLHGRGPAADLSTLQAHLGTHSWKIRTLTSTVEPPAHFTVHASIPIEMTESTHYAAYTTSAAKGRRPIAQQYLEVRCEASPWRLGPRLVLGTLVSKLLKHHILWGAGREFVPLDPLAGLPARPG